MDKDKKNNVHPVHVNDSAALGECESEFMTPVTAKTGAKVLKLPVTLSELTVKTNLAANITFPSPVLEIKDMKKTVKIVQCSLLLPAIHKGAHDPFNIDGFPAFRLFIKGFVRQNIQYATPCNESDHEGISSVIRSLTVDVPFSTVTKVSEFISPPQLPFSNTSSEFDFYRAQPLGHGYPEKDQLQSNDLSQYHQVSTQYYNQLPYCELLSSRIVEWDEAIDRRPLCGHNSFEGLFYNMEEKIFLEVTVNIMQNQQVRIKAL
ncbi:DUF3794 domain-containing protein [Niallia sp. XMNu-256]|uniref:CsxC family protein n=1 Tax=Niallia sp. XMNu-256 TaxID=3082444 RepID=UPI0030D2718F